MPSVMNIDHPLAIGGHTNHPLRREQQPVDDQQRCGIIVAIGALSGLERRPLNLYELDATDFAHIASRYSFRARLGWSASDLNEVLTAPADRAAARRPPVRLPAHRARAAPPQAAPCRRSRRCLAWPRAARPRPAQPPALCSVARA